MKIREFQKKIADALNGVEELVQGGCKAVAEDSLSVINEVQTQLQQYAGVAIVVTTPSLTRNGCSGSFIPCDAKMSLKCLEIPAINREHQGHLTALDAAETAAAELDGEQFNFAGMSQTADSRTGVITVTVEFNTTINIQGD